MELLNLPKYNFKIIEKDQSKLIFDQIRKKYVALTPEEWVRQNFIMFLVSQLEYPKSLISIEKGLKLYKKFKRSDIVVYGKLGDPLLIVECKAPQIKINQKTFDQITRYNMALNVKFLVVTNGLEHFCCQLNFKDQSYLFLEKIPNYPSLLTKG